MTPIQQIKAAIRCDEYIGRYLDVRNGKALCPFHKEKTASLEVHEDYYHCFGCGGGGDVIAFACQYHSISIRDAIRLLAVEIGATLTHQPAPHPYDAAKTARTAAECAQWAINTRSALLVCMHTDDYDRILPFLTALESMNRSQLLAAYVAQRTPAQGSLLRESIREADLWVKAMTPVVSQYLDHLQAMTEEELYVWQYGERVNGI